MTNLSLHPQCEKARAHLSSCNGGGAREATVQVGGDGTMARWDFCASRNTSMANPFFVRFSGNTGICPPRQRPLPECGGGANADQSPLVLWAIRGAGYPLSWIDIHHPHTLRARAPRKVPLSWHRLVQRAAGWTDEIRHQTMKRSSG